MSTIFLLQVHVYLRGDVACIVSPCASVPAYKNITGVFTHPSSLGISLSPVLTSFVLATAGKTRPGIFDPVNRMDKKNRGRLARDESGVGERAEKERAKGRGWRAYSPIKT